MRLLRGALAVDVGRVRLVETDNVLETALGRGELSGGGLVHQALEGVNESLLVRGRVVVPLEADVRVGAVSGGSGAVDAVSGGGLVGRRARARARACAGSGGCFGTLRAGALSLLGVLSVLGASTASAAGADLLLLKFLSLLLLGLLVATRVGKLSKGLVENVADYIADSVENAGNRQRSEIRSNQIQLANSILNRNRMDSSELLEGQTLEQLQALYGNRGGGRRRNKQSDGNLHVDILVTVYIC